MFSCETVDIALQAKFIGLVIGCFLIALVMAVLSYRITNPPLGRGRKKLLIALRIAAFFFLFLSIFEPLFIGTKKEIIKPHLMVVVDDSRSMTIEDNTGKRAETVEQILKGEELNALEGKYPIDYYAFGDTLVPLEELTFERNATALGEIILNLNSVYTPEEIGALLILSDGQSNLGITPLQVTEDLKYPIYTVGIGDPEAPRDVGIKRVVANDIAYQEQSFPVRVYLESWGMAGQRVNVTISLNQETIAKQQVELSEVGELNEVKFDVQSNQPGLQNFLVTVPFQDGEFSRKNNSKYFSVKILETKRKILLVTKALDWEYSFFKRVIADNENIEFEEYNIGKTRILGQLPVFPSEPEELSRYECIILFNVISDLARKNYGELFQNYVEKGGSILYFIQENLNLSSAQEPYWDNILPFHLSKGTNKVTLDNFNAVLSIEGLYHSITNIESSDNLPLEQSFLELPPLEGFLMIGPLDEGAKDLLVHPKLREVALFVAGNYKAGKIFSITAFPIWRWGFVPAGFGKDVQVYEQLMNNLIQWLLVKDEMEPFVLKTDKNVYKNGERINITSFLRNDNNQAVSGATVKVKLTRISEADSIAFKPLDILLDEYEKGIYEHRIPSLPPGKYQLSGEAFIRDNPFSKSTRIFIVEEYSLEFQNVRMDKNTLLRLAERTNGRYFEPSRLKGLSDSIRISEKSIRVKMEKNMWDHPLFLILFIVCLATEWILRKRSDLL
ncbi:hypothetical protein JW877_06990 [bacterium]|nr:hypothetical protein [bacterium]